MIQQTAEKSKRVAAFCENEQIFCQFFYTKNSKREHNKWKIEKKYGMMY